MPRLFECVIFGNELDLLELRFRTGSHLVDQYVLVEARRTFSGRPKPPHFQDHRERFRRWTSKLRHVLLDDLPSPAPSRWPAEVHQRNAILLALDDAEKDDVVVVVDADELVHPGVLASLRHGVRDLTALEMPSTFFRANWELPLGQYACAVRAIPFGMLVDPHRQRNHTAPVHLIPDAGRHFSNLLGPAQVQSKFETFAHSELDNVRDKALPHIRRAQELGVDLRSRDLVTVVEPGNLCGLQRELQSMRPDLFDFRALPSRLTRTRFRWYSDWRSRQPPESERVAKLDEEYDDRVTQVTALGIGAAARSVLSAAGAGAKSLLYTRPRRRAGKVKRWLLRRAASLRSSS